jgi:Ribbon-helix-helix protein, copG family
MMTACITQAQLPGGPMNQLTRCDRLIQIRAPEFLAKALDSAAGKQLTSRSDYIRIALLDRLKVDGIDPAHTAVANEG